MRSAVAQPEGPTSRGQHPSLPGHHTTQHRQRQHFGDDMLRYIGQEMNSANCAPCGTSRTRNPTICAGQPGADGTRPAPGTVIASDVGRKISDHGWSGRAGPRRNAAPTTPGRRSWRVPSATDNPVRPASGRCVSCFIQKQAAPFPPRPAPCRSDRQPISSERHDGGDAITDRQRDRVSGSQRPARSQLAEPHPEDRATPAAPTRQHRRRVGTRRRNASISFKPPRRAHEAPRTKCCHLLQQG